MCKIEILFVSETILNLQVAKPSLGLDCAGLHYVLCIPYIITKKLNKIRCRFLLFNDGVVVVVCCLRSCFGLDVTIGKGFKMDSLSPCLRSMGLSEARARKEERGGGGGGGGGS